MTLLGLKADPCQIPEAAQTICRAITSGVVFLIALTMGIPSQVESTHRRALEWMTLALFTFGLLPVLSILTVLWLESLVWIP